MIAAETAAKFRGLFSPNPGGLDAITTRAEAYGTGKLLTSKAFQRFLLGTDKTPLDFRSLRIGAAVMSEIREDISQTQTEQATEQ